MTKWLSGEWFEETRAMVADQPGPLGLAAGIQVEVTGGPDGDVRYYRVFEDGRLADSGVGTLDDPEVTVTLVWGDAVAIQRGELDPNVAFMQGRMKVVGSMGVMVKLLPLANTAACQELRVRMAELTDW